MLSAFALPAIFSSKNWRELMGLDPPLAHAMIAHSLCIYNQLCRRFTRALRQSCTKTSFACEKGENCCTHSFCLNNADFYAGCQNGKHLLSALIQQFYTPLSRQPLCEEWWTACASLVLCSIPWQLGVHWLVCEPFLLIHLSFHLYITSNALTQTCVARICSLDVF
jgi:hypothetical protein